MDAPATVYRMMESRAEAQQAIGEVLAAATRVLRIFDLNPTALQEREFGRTERIEAMRNVLRASRNHRLQIALHETRGIESELPRLVQLMTQFSGQIAVHRTLGAAREARDPLVLADDAHFWHKLHADHPRSVLTLHDINATQPLLERFEQIWESSELAVSGGTLGL